MKNYLIMLFLVVMGFEPSIANAQIGTWQLDEHSLPVFNYVGDLPFSAVDREGNPASLPNDPWFMLGNYRINLFTHVSGNYQIITGQRAWARVNMGEVKNTGSNKTRITIENTNEVFDLTGLESLSASSQTSVRNFGCGYAAYTYQIGDIICSRTISVKPSEAVNQGIPAFSISVGFENKSNERKRLVFEEIIDVNYLDIRDQRVNPAHRALKYTYSEHDESVERFRMVNIDAHSDDPLHYVGRDEMALLDMYPPSVFLAIASGKGKVMAAKNKTGVELNGKVLVELEPGESKTIQLVAGINHDRSFNQAKLDVEALTLDTSVDSNKNFSLQWKKVLPLFENEKDAVMRREMIWNAYVLETMAQYSEYYNETKIPQGTIYDYYWGQHASARDNFQHALPLVYYNPQLAKSVLRYMMQRTTPLGEIRLIEVGNAYSNNYSYFTSDQQLYFFNLLGEYLRVTGDYQFLNEKVRYFPSRNMPEVTVLELVGQCFRFLRDEIGTGRNGLVRLMNSDWNDAVFYIVDAPYNKALFSGESHMNSAMAVTILDNLVPQLKAYAASSSHANQAALCNKLASSMELFRNRVFTAFMNDLGDRRFSRRMYFYGKTYGTDNMFLEPQGFMLQMTDLEEKRKRELYNEMVKRVYAGEKLGARQQEDPEFEDAEFDKGSRENGGFWWALNGPVVLGLATFDKEEAMKRLRMMTFDNYARQFPDFWTSYWSASDNIESSLIPMEGLPDQSWTYWEIPVYCAHPHAWPLYCYFKLSE